MAIIMSIRGEIMKLLIIVLALLCVSCATCPNQVSMMLIDTPCGYYWLELEKGGFDDPNKYLTMSDYLKFIEKLQKDRKTKGI